MSLYLAASLYCDDVSAPAKIRNISSSGALVETSSVLAPGTLVQLVRGSLIVHALVAWSDGHRCGLQFSGTIDVDLWRKPTGGGEQQRVDEIVRLVKAGAVPLPVSTARSDRYGIDSGAQLSADLRRAAELLEQLGERIARDSIMVSIYPAELQNLDIAMQMIGALQVVLSGQSDFATEMTRIDSLRKSADEALARAAA